MAHFTITIENRDELLGALTKAEEGLELFGLPGVQGTWIDGFFQIGSYREAVEDFDGDGDQLILNTAPVSIPNPVLSIEVASKLRSLNEAVGGLEQFIALCPHCGWGEFLNTVRATLDNARVAV